MGQGEDWQWLAVADHCRSSLLQTTLRFWMVKGLHRSGFYFVEALTWNVKRSRRRTLAALPC